MKRKAKKAKKKPAAGGLPAGYVSAGQAIRRGNAMIAAAKRKNSGRKR